MNFEKALTKCMNICSSREYCSYDIVSKLKKWEVDESVHENVINELISEKFIDHKRYVSAFVNDKFKFNHWGKNKIKYHLKQKNIESSIIEHHLNNIDENEYNQVIINEIKNKRNKAKGKNQFEINQKVTRYLLSKGFETNKIFDLLKHA